MASTRRQMNAARKDRFRREMSQNAAAAQFVPMVCYGCGKSFGGDSRAGKKLRCPFCRSQSVAEPTDQSFGERLDIPLPMEKSQ